MLIAHITDPHIGLQPGLLTGPVDPSGGLRRALEHVRGLQPAIDVLLLTGDLADSGQAFLPLQLLAHLAFGGDVAHDHGPAGRQGTRLSALGAARQGATSHSVTHGIVHPPVAGRDGLEGAQPRP